MGTRGYRIFKFRGRYWIFYNHFDSYPSGLGQSLVDSIPADPEEYQNWLQSQRNHFAKWDSLLQKLLTIQPEDMRKLHSGEPLDPPFHVAFDERLSGNAPPCYKSGFNDLWIEWTYTIDLDLQVFSVDNGAHYRLNHMAHNDGWIEALFLDSRGNRFSLPQLVPDESIASLSLDPPSFTTSTKYEALQTRLVKAKGLKHLPPSYLVTPRLRWMLFKLVRESQQRTLSALLLSWKAQDLAFRELAFLILCLATGGENIALVDKRLVKTPYEESLYVGIMTGNEPEGVTELASALGVGYHMDGLPMGSAPTETKYWFEGALISLVPQLDYPGILEGAVADAVDYGRAFTEKPFNALLISIENLVLIRSLPDGSVDHTELLPLIPIPSHLSKDSRARYGQQALDEFYKDSFSKNKQGFEEPETEDEELETEDEEPQTEDEEPQTEDEEHETEDKEHETEDEEEHDEGVDDEVELQVLEGNELERRASSKNTFMALIQFFEATTLETLRPTQPNETRLPEEIYEMVLRNVSDMGTFNACLKVSRRFRLICQKRPLVMDDVTFLEPLPKDPAPFMASDKKDGTQNLPPAPDFLAVELSSGRQMEVELNMRHSNDALTCLIVAGHEWNRKTYVARCDVKFHGLCLSAIRVKKAGERDISTARRRSGGYSLHGSEDTIWGVPFLISNESETPTLGSFWENVMPDLNHPIRTIDEPNWTFPPNTLCYVGRCYRQYSGGTVGRKTFDYLYLRIKRMGSYWGSPWDVIIRETTDHLGVANERATKHREGLEAEVMGADDPYVMLVVGVEVRLFRWNQGFDDSVDEAARRKKSPYSTLRELNPESTLSVCDKADREAIERFLDKAGELRKTIEARESQKSEGRNE